MEASASLYTMPELVDMVAQFIDPALGTILQARDGRTVAAEMEGLSIGLAEAMAAAGMTYNTSILTGRPPTRCAKQQPPSGTSLITVTVTHAVAAKLPTHIAVRRVDGADFTLRLRGGPCFACHKCGGKHGRDEDRDSDCPRRATRPHVSVDEPKLLIAKQQQEPITAAPAETSAAATTESADGFKRRDSAATDAAALAGAVSATSSSGRSKGVLPTPQPQRPQASAAMLLPAVQAAALHAVP